LRPDLKENITAPTGLDLLPVLFTHNKCLQNKKRGDIPQIRLTKVNKRRHYSNGVGNKMYELYLVVVQQPRKKSPTGRLKPRSKKDVKTTCSLTSSVGN
jgi:hypothetical protein